MSWFFRLATAAVQRECLRLRGDRAAWKNRATTAERHQALADAQIGNQHRVVQEQAAEIKNLRHWLDQCDHFVSRVEHEACEQQADRDRAEIERLETELRYLASDHLELSGRCADLEQRLAFRSNEADRANAQVHDYVTSGQRYDLDDVGQEKRHMDRGDAQ